MSQPTTPEPVRKRPVSDSDDSDDEWARHLEQTPKKPKPLAMRLEYILRADKRFPDWAQSCDIATNYRDVQRIAESKGVDFSPSDNAFKNASVACAFMLVRPKQAEPYYSLTTPYVACWKEGAFLDTFLTLRNWCLRESIALANITPYPLVNMLTNVYLCFCFTFMQDGSLQLTGATGWVRAKCNLHNKGWAGDEMADGTWVWTLRAEEADQFYGASTYLGMDTLEQKILMDKHGRRAHNAGALKWIYKREKKKDGKVKLKDVTGTKIFPPLPNMSRFDVQQSEAPTLEE